jgi:hypothetical protein
MKKFEWGGTAESSETGFPIGGENQSSMYGKGGNIKVGDVVNLPEIKKGKVQFDKVENGVVKYIENGVYGVYNPKTKRIHQVLKSQIETYGKGGNLKKKANYVPNYMVQSVEVERKGKTTDIDGANVIDGVYVKKGVKYAKGSAIKGKKFKEGDYVFANMDTRNPSAKTPFIVSYWSNDAYYILGDGSHYVSEEKLSKATEKDFDNFYSKLGYSKKAIDSYKNIKYQEGGELNEMFPENDAMSYEDGGSTNSWCYSIGGL